MNLDHFLTFWTQHNITIIEGLCLSILTLCLIVAYSAFFNKGNATEDSVDGVGRLDSLSKNLELAVQNILVQQQSSASQNSSIVSASIAGSATTSEGISSVASSGSTSESNKPEIENRDRKILELNNLLKHAQEELDAEKAKVKSPGGMDANIKSDYDKKIQNLEQRVAEYEIIAEDIADLSKYKEENANLKRDLENLKKNGAPSEPIAKLESAPVAAPVADPVPAPTPAPEPVAEPAPAAAPVAMPVAESAVTPNPAQPEAVPEVVPEVVPQVESQMASQVASPAPENSISSVIDDDLMKEFAAAVASQKSGTLDGSKAAASGTESDSTKMIDEFEQFVKKAN